jgi:RNA polymerase sigma-70 factor, ECF subfamily
MDVALASDAYRGELLAHCYRMLGSLHDAEDLVQETMLRAWRSADRYDPSRASLRTWLYRIATNACLSALESSQRRTLPAALSGPSGTPDVEKLKASSDIGWLEPFPDALLSGDPATIAESRDSVRLAFVAALQYLPPRQRAVLILRDVLSLSAAEVAGLLDTSTASVNSALQRARAQLGDVSPAPDTLAQLDGAAERDLLDRYTAAFQAMDVQALKQTLREDALLQMPPFPAWFSGRDPIGEFFSTVFARGGSHRLIATRANGQPALAAYRRRHDDTYRFQNIELFAPDQLGIARIDVFFGAELAVSFGLPQSLDDATESPGENYPEKTRATPIRGHLGNE